MVFVMVTLFSAPVLTFHPAAHANKRGMRLYLGPVAVNGASPADPSSRTAADSDKEELAAKLAAAEAEAQALRTELSARRSSKDVDTVGLKRATHSKRIDGTGYRETLFSGPGKARTGSADQQFNRWGLSEAELFLSKGAPTEGAGLGVRAFEDGSEEIVRRRLIVGGGLALVAGVVASIKLPSRRPSKPLFFYLTSIWRLREQLQFIEDSSSDVQVLREQLKKVYASPDAVRDDFLSAAAWLEGADAERATSLAYSIFEYLYQTDYTKYFDNLAEPTSTQEVEFLKFSLQCAKAARESIDEFVQLSPLESIEAARAQVPGLLLAGANLKTSHSPL